MSDVEVIEEEGAQQEQQRAEVSERETFAKLGLDARLVKGLFEEDIRVATEVQQKAIPVLMQGRDTLIRARTGSGKTLAFILPIIERILRIKQQSSDGASDGRSRSNETVLLLVPTRELVNQIGRVIKDTIKHCSDEINLLTLVSSQDILSNSGNDNNHSNRYTVKQIRARKLAAAENELNERRRLSEKPDIIVCTPSKLHKHLRSNKALLNDLLYVSTICIDEADLMLSHDFEKDIKSIVLSMNSAKRSKPQIILCSATLNPYISKLQHYFIMNDPVLISITEDGFDDNKLTEYYLRVRNYNDKFVILFALFKLQIIKGRTLIFTHNIEIAYRCKLFLEKFLIKTAVLSPQLPLASRQSIIDRFNRGMLKYLITTDIDERSADYDDVIVSEDVNMSSSADDESGNKKDKNRVLLASHRGVDFREVAAVLSFSAPLLLSKYIHRIGRTARAGAYGVAITLVTPREMEVFGSKILSQRSSKLEELPLSMDDLSSFKYRCDSMRCSITQAMVKRARLNELKLEIINSQRLQRQLESTSDDDTNEDGSKSNQIISHDKYLQSSEYVKPHLSQIPSYLIRDTHMEAPRSNTTVEYKNAFGKLPSKMREMQAKQRLRNRMRKNPALKKNVFAQRSLRLSVGRHRAKLMILASKNRNNSLLLKKSQRNSGQKVSSLFESALKRTKEVERGRPRYVKTISTWKTAIKDRKVQKLGRGPSFRGMGKKQIHVLKRRNKQKRWAKRKH